MKYRYRITVPYRTGWQECWVQYWAFWMYHQATRVRETIIERWGAQFHPWD